MEERSLDGYRIIRSDRRSLAIEILRQDAEVVIRAPRRLSGELIEKFISEHRGFIVNGVEKVKARIEKEEKLLSECDDKALAKKAKEYLPSKIKYYSDLMGLVPTGVKITSAKTRYGSCSPKNSLCFSLYLMQKDERFIDYVIVHELAHIKHHNHGKAFYKLIEKYMPDYKERIRIGKE